MLGIRTRVAGAAAIATVAVLSVVGALGFKAMVDATRQSQINLLDERLDDLEERLEDNDRSLVGINQLDSSLRVIRIGRDIPAQGNQSLQVVRSHPDPGIRAIVGNTDTSRIDASFETIRTALWISVLVIGLIVGAIAWLVVDRALSPVRRLTNEVEGNMASRSLAPLVVNDSRDEVSELAGTFNRMLRSLRLEDVDRRRFVSNASHELRTPLMVLQADAEFASDQAANPETTELAMTVLKQTGRLTSLVDDLVTLAALDEADMNVVDAATVAEVISLAGADELIDPLSPALSGLAIPDVTRAISNIVSNARRHQESMVQLTVESDSDVVRFVVDDDGPGVPLAEREQIFKRFYRPDHDRNRSDGGAGLGLAIARTEILQAGGSVRVEESPLGGARFIATVPIDQASKSYRRQTSG